MNGLFKEAAKAFPKLNPTERQTIKPGPAVDATASISLIFTPLSSIAFCIIFLPLFFGKKLQDHICLFHF